MSIAEDFRDTRDDATAAAVTGFLRSEGAADLGHAGGQTLLDHLLGTYSILRRWGQPEWLQHAALIHSVYGTESYEPRLISPDRRDEVTAVAGAEAERLAYLFCATPRQPLFAGTYRWARDLPARAGIEDWGLPTRDPPRRDELDALVLLHMANLADQARAADGSPGRWLVRARDLAELLIDSDSVTPPRFAAQLAELEGDDESVALTVYRDALLADGEARTAGLALAAVLLPVVAEPCVWLAHDARGDAAATRSWTAEARRRMATLGTAWDKRLSYEEWLTLIDALDGDAPRTEEALAHPGELFEALVGGVGTVRATSGASARVVPDAHAGRERFQRYIESLAGDPSARAVYPDLPSRPWHDPGNFPLAGYLEAHFEEIRGEILALGGARFHRESERISRTGDWDVAFLYERGRRHDDVCAACPVTTRGIDTHPAIRGVAGLIYVSRMRAHTHIAPHRGPTNLRVRCHLAITVPGGDCAIRVRDETRRWVEGRCLVFDDYFVHEAWNHTDEDRIVLIVDLWHPGLAGSEVTLLEGLHSYTYHHARRLGRYWSANDRAAGRAGPW